jgi:hypothetical protein
MHRSEPVSTIFHRPAPVKAEPTDLRSWLAEQREYYRTLGTDAALLLAEHVGVLLDEARILHADTAARLRDRREELEDRATEAAMLDAWSAYAADRDRLTYA